MRPYIMHFSEIDSSKINLVGGKGVNLGELYKMKGISVPEGFSVTTEAYEAAMGKNSKLNDLLNQLISVTVHEKENIIALSSQIRYVIEETGMTPQVKESITQALKDFDQHQPFAVRSSATAEDLPTASFAGQQDTYLNVIGSDEVLKHVVKCWASLFTERAVTYRIKNGFDHRKVFLSVIVQKMVNADVSGILFTADPVTSDRKTMSIDAGFGLGEALVSGLVTPDTYKVRNNNIVYKRVGLQTFAIRAGEENGTQQVKLDETREITQALSDDQIFRLTELGVSIQNHFEIPQDVEWCLVNYEFFIVQSRPITTLFPPPKSVDDVKRVYMSVGHMQVMTDPILPLGISVFNLASQFPVDKAGGRLFVDITFDLATAQGRRMIKQKVNSMDPLMASSISKVLADKNYIKSLPSGKGNLLKGTKLVQWVKEAFRLYRENDPAILDEMINMNEISLKELDNSLNQLSGIQVFDTIFADQQELKAQIFDPTIFGSVLVCQYVAGWINKHADKWLGEKNVTNVFSKSVDHNITSEMGLALCDVADVVREYQEVQDYLSDVSRDKTAHPVDGQSHVHDENFFTGLIKCKGGSETADVLIGFLDKYGMRCPGEIDITKPRFNKNPSLLIPSILSDVKLLKPGEHTDKFEKGKQEAWELEEKIINHLQRLSGGTRKAKKAKKMISVFRHYIGAREYAKYFWVSRYDIYKRALLKEADQLAAAGIIKHPEDVYYLYLDEFMEAVKTGKADNALIEQRKQDYVFYHRLTPPRIIFSDGEVPPGEYNNDSAPEDALLGVPVSSGVVEGRARVVTRLEDAYVDEGDILVTHFTDPSWTPVFVTIAGLITEVGGEMSHGAVITREYGLPAVVGVENATKLIKDGQMLRLNGTDGYVEMLD